MKLSAKITLSVVLIVSLTLSISGYAIISSVFHAQLKHQITAAVEENQLLCSVLGTMAVERRTSTAAQVTADTLQETLTISPFRDYRLRLVTGGGSGKNVDYQIVRMPEQGKEDYELVVTCGFSVDQGKYFLESRRDVSDLYRLRAQYLITYKVVYLIAVAVSLAAWGPLSRRTLSVSSSRLSPSSRAKR